MIDRLLDHDRWATTQLLDSSRVLTDAQLDQEFDIGHRTLRATYEHMIFNVEAWTAVMAGQPVASSRDSQSIAVLIGRDEGAHAALAALARRVRDAGSLDNTFIDHFGEPMTFSGAIVHVVLHDAEHRGEAMHILERLGVPDLPEIDHGLWDHVSRAAYRVNPTAP